ncbi:MAG: septal ring lytic transglycosylase RlpA family protein [Methylocella sp.]|nr:MAG: septal ring lytic transglycosylase RlpA family lipoprotein [Hyphomicrobiales bacterium]
MRAKRILCVSARSFAVFSRFPRKADAPVRCIVAGLAGSAALSLGGCAQQPQRLAYANSTEYFPSSIYGPASPRVVADGEPVPRGGGMYMLGKPYTVAGLTYYPSEKHYAAIGLASWYGDAFHGRRTANGEVFDRDSVSAAHPTLPLPSYARVTNLRNHYSMIVRVNDRGPFAAHRIMDVSHKTAEALDFCQRGTTPVKIEYIGAASLAGSNDQKLLATLRLDGPASLAGWEGRDRGMVAANAPPLAAPAEAGSISSAAGDAAAEPDSAPASRASGRQVPLPPARPFDLGTIPGAGVPIALR